MNCFSYKAQEVGNVFQESGQLNKIVLNKKLVLG